MPEIDINEWIPLSQYAKEHNISRQWLQRMIRGYIGKKKANGKVYTFTNKPRLAVNEHYIELGGRLLVHKNLIIKKGIVYIGKR